MANRDIIFGIRITGDASSAVREAQKVGKAFEDVSAGLKDATASAIQAQLAIGATMQQFAPQPAVDTAKAVNDAAAKIGQLGVSATAAARPLADAGAALGGVGEKAPQLEPATRKVGELGMSAAQTAQALRQLPMQFTDIFTSLAAGQPPMMVMLQQGGQLKDTFGGIAPAARAMGGYIAGLVTPLGAAAVAAGALAVAYYQGSKESDRLASSIILTGNAAGTSAAQLNAMVGSVAQAAKSTKSAAAGALEAAVASGKIAQDSLALVGEVAVRMQRAVGKEVADTVAEFAKLGKDPVKASEELNDKYGYLTASVYAQIKALQDQGRTLDSVALAQKTFAEGSLSAARQIEENYGNLETLFMGLRDMAAGAWDAALGVGRQSSDLERIAELRQKMAPGRGVFAGLSDEERQELARLDGKVKQKEAEARAQAASNAQTKASIELAKKADESLSKEDQKKRDIARLQETYNQAIQGGAVSTAEIVRETRNLERALAGVEEKYKERERAPRRVAAAAATPGARLQDDWTRRIQVLEAETGLTQALTDTQKAGIKIMTDYASGRLKLTAAERAGLPALVQRALLLDDANEAEKRARAEAESMAKVQADLLEDERKSTDALLAKLEAAKLEADTYGLSEEAVYRLLSARTQDRIEMLSFGDANDALIAELKAQAQAYLDLADAAGAKASRQASKKAAEDAQVAERKFADDIERALTDALMRGFESGKDMGTAFVDSLRNMLKTAALKVAVQMVAQPITSGLAGLMGGSGTAAGGSGLGGLGNLASMGMQAAGMTGMGAYTGAAGFLQVGSMASSFSSGLSAAAAGADLSAAIAAYEAAGMTATAGSLSAGASAASALGSSATLLSSALSGVMAAAPYIGAAILIAQQLGAFKGPTYHKGGAYLAGTDGTAQKATAADVGNFNLGWGAYSVDRMPGYDDAMLGLSTGLAKQIGESVKRYGGEALDLTIAARFASDNDDWSEGAYRVIDAWGNTVTEVSRRYTSDANKALEQFGQDSVRALLASLQRADLNDEYEGLLDGLDPLKASVEEITNLLTRVEAIQQQIEGITTGIDAAFLAPAEQLDKAFAALGQSIPGTAQAYEALVRAQDLNTAAGRSLAASLLGVYGLWGQVEDAAKQAADEAQRAAEAQMAALMDAVTGARGDLVSAYQDEVSALDSTVSRFRGFAADLRKFRESLTLGALSHYTPGQKYAEAARQFDVTYAAAMAGDETAMGQLQGVAQAFLEASQVYNASSDAYVADFAKVQAALSNSAISADASADVAKLQLTAARDQLKLLGEIDAGTKSVADAMRALSAAVLAAVDAGVNPGFGTVGALTGGVKDEWVSAGSGLSAWQSLGGATATRTDSGVSVQGLGGQMYSAQDLIGYWSSGLTERQIYDSAKSLGITLRELDAFMGWPAGTATRWAQDQGLPAFANGGDHTGGMRLVGERGPEIEATGPARYWSFEQSRQMLSGGDSGLLAEVRALREEVRALRGQQQSETAAVIEAQFRAADRNAEAVASARSRDRWSATTRPEVV